MTATFAGSESTDASPRAGGFERGPSSRVSVPAVIAPLLRLPGALVSDRRPATPLENSTALRRQDGWGTWTVELNDHGNGLYLAIRGRVQFEHAAVCFADGEDRMVDLRRATRDDGLYLLVDFGGDREVASVTLDGRARNEVAYVGLRLGRNR